MENASKALIIAGAILLSIVLITLGVVIIGRGQEAVDKANIDDQVVSTWNQKFTSYAGDSVRGTDVNILINAVLSSNATNKNAGDTDKLIKITTTIKNNSKEEAPGVTPNNTTSAPIYTKSCDKVNQSAKYNVTVTYGDKGYISEINIVKVKG